MLREIGYLRRSGAQIVLSACILVAALVTSHELAAQTTGTTAPNTNPAVQPESALANQYLIGPGDVLDIRIYNRPLLSRESVRVDERGMVRMPLITEVRAECRTETELAQALGTTYLEYLKNPHVEVFIKEYTSKPVIVLGAVKAPGRFQLQRRVDIVELVSLAGGLNELADGKIQVTHASGRRGCEPSAGGYQPAPVAQNSDSEAVEWFDLDELLSRSRSGGGVPFAEPGDTITLLEANKAFVVGNVVKPVEISLKDEVTLSQAIAMAGGTMPDSRLEKIRILRQPTSGGPKGEMIVDLKAINKQEQKDIVLQANDIVEVPTSAGKRFMRGLMDGFFPGLARLPVQIIR